jgi:LuxR family maltose regulon positive regulatory protein
MPDEVYMPFVENCDFISALLEQLRTDYIYHMGIGRILELYEVYRQAATKILEAYSSEDKPKLTQREKEVAELVVEGLTNKEIGESLFVSQNTIKTQLKSVFEKLGVNSRSLLRQYFNEES